MFICSKGNEIRLRFRKGDDKGVIDGYELAMNEWHTLKIAFDTNAKKYRVYVNDTAIGEYSLKMHLQRNHSVSLITSHSIFSMTKQLVSILSM